MTSPRLDPLSRLAVRFGSDKYGVHLYTPIYHSLFSPLRELPIRLLEIGVGGYDSPRAGGASLQMWAEYFPYARIVGLDVFEKQLDISPRVTIVRGSQIDAALLQTIDSEHGPFDIVIDDGSHVVQHVLATFSCLYPLIAPDGIYVVEDTLTAFDERTGGRPNGAGSIFGLAHALSLAMHRRQGYEIESDDDLAALADRTRAIRFYRNLIVFERGDNSYPARFGVNFHLDIDDPRVRQVYDGIEAEASNNPSNRGCLSRVAMWIWAHRPDKAVALALEAAEAHPGDIGLLSELAQLMHWAGQHEAAQAIMARIAAPVARAE